MRVPSRSHGPGRDRGCRAGRSGPRARSASGRCFDLPHKTDRDERIERFNDVASAVPRTLCQLRCAAAPAVLAGQEHEDLRPCAHPEHEPRTRPDRRGAADGQLRSVRPVERSASRVALRPAQPRMPVHRGRERRVRVSVTDPQAQEVLQAHLRDVPAERDAPVGRLVAEPGIGVTEGRRQEDEGLGIDRDISSRCAKPSGKPRSRSDAGPGSNQSPRKPSRRATSATLSASGTGSRSARMRRPASTKAIRSRSRVARCVDPSKRSALPPTATTS